ncbi:hypothetical protein Tco_0638058, partial [Tanacetum coccineum]
MAKGCQVFLAQISAKKEEDKSEGKQIKDVPIVRDFPKVFPEDLPGLPPARPVEFQIDLISGTAPIARAPEGVIGVNRLWEVIGVSCGVLWEVVLQETVGNGVVWVLAGTWRVAGM